jgi:hypothetical protein
MRITKLEVRNFKRVRAVSINPDGSVVKITGRNKQGKTSTLDGIAALLGGEKLCPAQPIRRGETEGLLRAEFDEDLVVERKFKLSGDGEVTSSLKVTRKDGLPVRKPQAILDSLVGRIAFDPLAFLREPAKKQAEVIREIAGIDLSPFDARRQTAYDGRTDVNRELAAAKARLASSPEVDAPDAEVSVADLLEEQSRRLAARDANEVKRRELRRVGDDFTAAKADLAQAQAEVARLESALAAAREAAKTEEAALEQVRTAGKALQAEVAALQDPNLAEVPAQIRDIDEVNRRVRAKRDRAALAAQVRDLEEKTKALTAAVEKAEEEKAAALAAAKLPIPGLSFTADGVLLHDLPFEQAAASEQLRVSMAVALATHPKLPIALIRDASLLDKDALALVGEMAEAAGAQVWLEMVSTDGEGVVIEDGEVVSENPSARELAS